jgi:hypothetical protein
MENHTVQAASLCKGRRRPHAGHELGHDTGSTTRTSDPAPRGLEVPRQTRHWVYQGPTGRCTIPSRCTWTTFFATSRSWSNIFRTCVKSLRFSASKSSTSKLQSASLGHRSLVSWVTGSPRPGWRSIMQGSNGAGVASTDLQRRRASIHRAMQLLSPLRGRVCRHCVADDSPVRAPRDLVLGPRKAAELRPAECVLYGGPGLMHL